MMRIDSLLTLGLFAAFLAQPLPIQAAANPDQGQSASDQQQKDKGGKETDKPGGIPRDPKAAEECIKNQGCLAHAVKPGDTSLQGTTCRTGMACNNVGASCVITGTMHCQTYDLNGQGNCTCACIAP